MDASTPDAAQGALSPATITTVPSDARSIRLTPHFYLYEFLHPDDPIPAPYILDNLYRLASRLQVVRDIVNRPIQIHSGYRTPERNRLVGGVRNSLHMMGMAADFSVQGVAPHAVQRLLMNWTGGLGQYRTFTHVDIRSHRARWRG